MKELYFQLDYIGFIRGDILMEHISQNKLISYIKESQEDNKNNICNELEKLKINETNYKKIMMINPNNLDVDEYIRVIINNKQYDGSRLYLGYCYIKK